MTRPERVAELIREEVSQIIRERVSDPRIGFISITRVDVSADLENAWLFVSIYGDENKKRQTMLGLNSATRFIRGELGQMLKLRLVPRITFVRDDSLEQGSRVLGIISRLEKEEHGKGLRRDKKGTKIR